MALEVGLPFPLLSRASLHEIMDHVGWKTPQTALHYIKLKEVLIKWGLPFPLLSRASLHEIMDHVRWKNPQTALHYIKVPMK